MTASVFMAIGLLAAGIAGEDPGRPADADPAAPRLSGGFIQLQGWMRDLTAEDWRRELRAMRDAGLEIVVIQYLETDDVSFIPEDDDAPDPARAILEFADAHGMRVFLGTKVDGAWWRWDEAYLARALEDRKRLVGTIQARYGRHPSFAGWYFAEETSGGLDPARVRQLRDYFGALSRHCKGLRDVPVAFAPFFSEITTPEGLREIYLALLDGAGIDILMLQDGVGARGWDRDLEARVIPYFRAFEEVCRARGVELWCDLESFRQGPDGGRRFVPASIERIERQLAAAAPFVREIVTFDFFHYMSPHRGEPQRRLYEAYRSRHVAPMP